VIVRRKRSLKRFDQATVRGDPFQGIPHRAPVRSAGQIDGARYQMGQVVSVADPDRRFDLFDAGQAEQAVAHRQHPLHHFRISFVEAESLHHRKIDLGQIGTRSWPNRHPPG